MEWVHVHHINFVEVEGLRIFGYVVVIPPLFILACWFVGEAASLLEVGSLFSISLGFWAGSNSLCICFQVVQDG